jgi:transposase
MTIKKGLKLKDVTQTQDTERAVATRPEIRAIVGIDLGDKRSSYCSLDTEGGDLGEGVVATTAEALRMVFAGTEKMRIAIECGTHSPWVSRLLQELGHEVIVANPRRLRLIAESNRKNDKADARTLATVAQAALSLLKQVHHRSERVQLDLAAIKARDTAVQARSRMVAAIRGIVKSTGGRLTVCSTGAFAKKAFESCPATLRDALTPLMRIIEQLTAEIRQYDRAIERKMKSEYPEAAPILTIPGVGSLTALTFVLLLNNDANRFSKSRDLGCYFGLQPKQQDSGRFISQLGITKAGDQLMRKLAVQCSHFMLGRFGRDSALRRWGLALCLRGGGNAKKRAVVAVARKLLILMHRLWKTQTAFVPFPAIQPVPQAA